MIVRCPECSTGFKLPDEQVSDSSVKLRCSKCHHVFRIRVADDGEVDYFYQDKDRAENGMPMAGESAKPDDGGEVGVDEEPQQTSLGKPMGVADADGPVAASEEQTVRDQSSSTTQFGMPSSDANDSEAPSGRRSPSKSASSDYNPFPHASTQPDDAGESDADVADSGQVADQNSPSAPADKELRWDDEATRVDQSGPFGDAFDESDSAIDAFDGAFDDGGDGQPGSADGADAATPTASDEPSGDDSSETVASTQAAAAGARAGAQSAVGVQSADPVQQTASSEQTGEPDQWTGGDQAYDVEEMVDPSFGQAGPTFDPDKGVVDANPHADAGGPSTAAGRDDEPSTSTRTPAAVNQSSSPTRQEPSTDSHSSESWEVDDIGDPVAPHAIGGSGLQKLANFLLIALVVGIGFLGLVAGLSGGMLDLKRFPHMLQVAFQGAEFAPREAWIPDAPTNSAPVPADPIRLRSVFATPVQLDGADGVILVRGTAENTSPRDYRDLVVRGILYDKNERPIAQTEASLGARLMQSKIADSKSPTAAKALLPSGSTPLASQSTEPFSLVFTDVPPQVFDTGNVTYRVEVANKKVVEGIAAASTSN